jgi:hypothetical protein
MAGIPLVEYVYHNSGTHKDIKGTRNEYRLYFSRELDGENFLEPGDLVLMKRVTYKGFDAIKIFLVKKDRNNSYKKLIKIIKDKTHYLTDNTGIPNIDNYDFEMELISNERVTIDKKTITTTDHNEDVVLDNRGRRCCKPIS